MSLMRLSIRAVRNLQPTSVQPSPRINLIAGDNGSGKTSFLEAIHLLGLARSFRSARLTPVIQDGTDEAIVFGQICQEEGHIANVGVSRQRNGAINIRINKQPIRSAAQLAEVLPLQLINPDSFLLLEGSPKVRRQFLDWGLFHVEPGFWPVWQRLQRALEQRNAWLRHGRIDPAMQAAWDQELCAASEPLDNYRRLYVQQLIPVFTDVLARLLALPDISLSYYRGWDKERRLADVLAAGLARDQQQGYTQAGPQRADLRLRLGSHAAADILSRGQQKLVVCALRIAQGHLVNRARYGQCIYLVDDLPSELDGPHRRALCRLLEELDCQVFITGVDLQTLKDGWRPETPVALFQIEQGRIESSGVKA